MLYGNEIVATSMEDAEDHLKAIRFTGKVIGHHIEGEIPAYPGTGLYVRFLCWYKNLGSLWIPGSCLERVIPTAYLDAVSSFSLPSNLALHNGQYPKSHR